MGYLACPTDAGGDLAGVTIPLGKDGSAPVAAP